jgi:hypothetical protein
MKRLALYIVVAAGSATLMAQNCGPKECIAVLPHEGAPLTHCEKGVDITNEIDHAARVSIIRKIGDSAETNDAVDLAAHSRVLIGCSTKQDPKTKAIRPVSYRAGAVVWH